jgi:hypothetical protein
VVIYRQIDMDFKQTIKEEQKQQQGEIYNHLLNIQHYMKREILAYSSNFQVGNGWENATDIMGEDKWLRIIHNKLQNVNRI